MVLIDTVYDFSDKGLGELKAWLEPWFRTDDCNCDCIPVGGVGPISDRILATDGLAGFWKLNESSGSTAADSSGFGLDLTTSGYADPLWGQTAAPPGEQTANFENGTVGPPGSHTGTATRVSRSWAAMTSDFTAGIWALRNPTAPADGSPNLHSPLMGHGNPARSGGKGWELGFSAFNTLPANRAFAVITGVGSITGLNPITDADGWQYLVVTYDAAVHEMKFYVNGILQGTATGTGATSLGTTPLWIGHDNQITPVDIQPCHCTLSYAFVFERALTETEIVSFVDPSMSIGDGWVLTAVDGEACGQWLPPTVKVAGTRYNEILLGPGLTATDNGDGTVTIDLA